MAEKSAGELEAQRTQDSSGEASSPSFTSLAAAFGMAIGELARAVGAEDDLEIALAHAATVARATYIAGAGRDS